MYDDFELTYNGFWLS
jgi:hypothetical protein